MLADTRRSFAVGPATVIHNGRRTDWVQARRRSRSCSAPGGCGTRRRTRPRSTRRRAWSTGRSSSPAMRPRTARRAAPGCSAGCRSTSSRCGSARAAVFAAPARYEPFGLGILEAALSGCALVLGDIASLRELWDGAAEFVDPDDPQALAAALDALAHAPGWCTHLAGRARRRAPRRFRPAAMARRYADEYQRLLRPRGGIGMRFAPVLPLAGLRLEPRQRPLPARRVQRARRPRPRGARLRAARRVEPGQPRRRARRGPIVERSSARWPSCAARATTSPGSTPGSWSTTRTS